MMRESQTCRVPDALALGAGRDAHDSGLGTDDAVVRPRRDGDAAGDPRTDEELMLVYQGGDRGAFNELYARYARPIHSFLRHSAQRPDVADDLFQKTFLNVHTGQHLYHPHAPFRSWIFAIARNVLRDDARQQRRRPSVALDELDAHLTSAKTPQRRSSRSEISLVVSKALTALSPGQREVIVLNRYWGMNYAEIGEVLGISENAVKQRAFQAMLSLRRSLHVGNNLTKAITAEYGQPCHEVRSELPALVAGTMNRSVQDTVEQHLSFCPGCQFEWREQEVVWRCLSQCEDVDPPEELRARLRDAIDAATR